jgi:hypothetical protein
VDAGMLSASDEEQINKAILEQRTLLTHNKKHFRIPSCFHPTHLP